MKLPFLNRKRYLVLKCYTIHEGVLQYAPIAMNYQHKMKAPDNAFNDKKARYFDSCLSRIKTKMHSATISAPLTMNVSVRDAGITYDFSDNNVPALKISFEHEQDPMYGLGRDAYLTKIIMPWRIEEETGTQFVVAQHMSNTTLMNLLSGVLEFKQNTSCNLFNMVHKLHHEYEIPFGTPMASLYPMCDLPLHVECYNDESKFMKLSELQYRKFNRSDGTKTEKLSM